MQVANNFACALGSPTSKLPNDLCLLQRISAMEKGQCPTVANWEGGNVRSRKATPTTVTTPGQVFSIAKTKHKIRLSIIIFMMFFISQFYPIRKHFKIFFLFLFSSSLNSLTFNRNAFVVPCIGIVNLRHWRHHFKAMEACRRKIVDKVCYRWHGLTLIRASKKLCGVKSIKFQG